jgi:hypothetical protein
MATRPYHSKETGGSVKEWKVAILSLMETSDTSAQAQCEPRMGGGCEQSTTTRSKNLKYSVNRARAAAVNFNIDYEVKELKVQGEPRTGGGCEL